MGNRSWVRTGRCFDLGRASRGDIGGKSFLFDRGCLVNHGLVGRGAVAQGDDATATLAQLCTLWPVRIPPGAINLDKFRA